MRIRLLLIVSALIPALATQTSFAASAPPDFAYRHVTLHVESADAQPLVKASIYGFCRDLNLLWPRRDAEAAGRDDVLWQESFLGTTGPDGTIKADLPPGHWRFFATGLTPQGTVVAAWTDAHDRADGETVRLAPTVTKQWTFRSHDGPLSPKRLLFKPDSFPIWIPVTLDHPAADSVPIELNTGHLQCWAEADPTPERPGFALSFGTLSDKTPDGNLPAPERPAVIESTGGNAVLSWTRRDNFGLRGELPLPAGAKVLLSPGPFSVAYRRPIADGLTATFVGQLYHLQSRQPLRLDFDSPLSAALMQELPSPDEIKKGQSGLYGQLFLVDGNGHLLGSLLDSNHKPVPITATVTIGDQHYKTYQSRSKIPVARKGTEDDDADDDSESDQSTFAPRPDQMVLRADVGSLASITGATWEFALPPGILTQTTLTPSPLVPVTSTSFKLDVPNILERHTANLLAQADTLARAMEQVSGRKQRHPVTQIFLHPSEHGASAGINGDRINFRPRVFFSDEPMLVHTFAHELGHHFGFHHGGLHESVVEFSRCAPGDQISQQPGKWLFLDRMNSLPTRRERPYRNVGLYLYCCAQAGPQSLLFLSRNEQTILKQLDNKYTLDELTNALYSLALGRDATTICRLYGLTIPPDHVAPALHDVMALCDTRR